MYKLPILPGWTGSQVMAGQARGQSHWQAHSEPPLGRGFHREECPRGTRRLLPVPGPCLKDLLTFSTTWEGPLLEKCGPTSRARSGFPSGENLPFPGPSPCSLRGEHTAVGFFEYRKGCSLENKASKNAQMSKAEDTCPGSRGARCPVCATSHPVGSKGRPPRGPCKFFFRSYLLAYLFIY